MRILLLSIASCAGSLPAQQMEDMRRSRLDGSCTQAPALDCDLALEDDLFLVTGLFTDNESNWLPSSDQTVSRMTTIASGDGWKMHCESEHQVDVGFEGGLYHTLGMSTRCKSGGRSPSVELFMEGWPDHDGLIITEGREYIISSTGRSRPESLLITLRGSTLRLAVGRSNQTWIRRGLDREERKLLVRIAATLWTTPALRAHEGTR